MGPTSQSVASIETKGLAASYSLHGRAMHRMMLDYGFRTMRHNPYRRVLRPAEGMDKANTIYIREVATVEQRVKEAEKFRVDDQMI